MSDAKEEAKKPTPTLRELLNIKDFNFEDMKCDARFGNDSQMMVDEIKITNIAGVTMTLIRVNVAELYGKTDGIPNKKTRQSMHNLLEKLFVLREKLPKDIIIHGGECMLERHKVWVRLPSFDHIESEGADLWIRHPHDIMTIAALGGTKSGALATLSVSWDIEQTQLGKDCIFFLRFDDGFDYCS